MSLAARVWITLGRGRRRWNKRAADDVGQARERWVRKHAAGRSFVDVGGLFDVEGDIAFLAGEVGRLP